MQLQGQFQTTKKDTLSISSYFCKLKNIVDSLTMAGMFISDKDFILQLLSGLPLEYDVVVVTINSHHITMPIEEVHYVLLNQKMCI